MRVRCVGLTVVRHSIRLNCLREIVANFFVEQMEKKDEDSYSLERIHIKRIDDKIDSNKINFGNFIRIKASNQSTVIRLMKVPNEMFDVYLS